MTFQLADMVASLDTRTGQFRAAAATNRLKFRWTSVSDTSVKPPLELIQPRSDGNIYIEFLRRTGPGLHHVGFVCG